LASSRKPLCKLSSGEASRNPMLIIIVLLAFLSGVYIGSRFFASREVE
jgi:hypothetical protein